MEKQKGKITSRGIFFVFLTSLYSPVVRISPNYTSVIAKQAGWLCPFFASILFCYLLCQINFMLNAFPGLSLLEIFEKITNKFIGKTLAIFFLIWVIITSAFNLKYYAEKYVTTIHPNIANELFMIVLIVLVAFVVRTGLIVVSRMAEIFFWLLMLSNIVLMPIMFPNISLDYLTPITYLDIIPVLKGSIGMLALNAFIVFPLFLSDNIKDIENIKKRGLQANMFLFFIMTLLLLNLIGNTGHYILANTSYAYLTAVEKITLLETVTGLESPLIVAWSLSDLILMSILTLVALRIIKYIFNIENSNIYINIILIMTFLLTKFIAKDTYELIDYSRNFGINTGLILCFVIPIIMSWIYKLRLKTRKLMIKLDDK
ncbi:MAG: GerAB/ArcD/ProY family transporter [Eubacteriaceae bacterium]